MLLCYYPVLTSLSGEDRALAKRSKFPGSPLSRTCLLAGSRLKASATDKTVILAPDINTTQSQNDADKGERLQQLT